MLKNLSHLQFTGKSKDCPVTNKT